jgi:class 3 adenylate cyclase/CHASE2 domain-containing sensor protein
MLKPFKRAPGLIALGVVLIFCLLRWLDCDYFERLERMTYDMRAREALRFPPPVATNLGFVFIDEASIVYVRRDRGLGYHFGLYWPRQVYGRLVEELADQGAKAVAFDVLFGELRDDHLPLQMADGNVMTSDGFFALQMRLSRNVIVAVTKDTYLPQLFGTNAMALAHIAKQQDSDGVLRRAQAFLSYTNWHPAFLRAQEELDYGIDLHKARVEPRQIILPRGTNGADAIRVPLDADGDFRLSDFFGDALPVGAARTAKPFTIERVWHMGVVLAAQELKLDLAKAEIDLPHGRITLRGPNGVERIIPVDHEGSFYVDWCLPPNHPKLTEESIQELLGQSQRRLLGHTDGLTNRWSGKLVVVGSVAVGNDLTDRGATPLLDSTFLVSTHWNVANSIITGRFIHRAPLAVDLAVILVMGLAAALLTLEMRILISSGLVVLLEIAYVVFGFVVYVSTRYWFPIVLPAGSLLLTHGGLVIWRVVFEQAERRRVKSILSTMVSPKIADVLVRAEKLALGGSRRQITVFFADVRGFTEFTDRSQEQVAEYVRAHNLAGAEAEACFDQQARETLETVNLYLGLLAGTVLKHDGTLDKFIGDCVMAFWGAPNPEPKHALACVRAAIEAQRAVYELNLERVSENKRREKENLARASAGLLPRNLMPILLLGSGINTGMATVGMMGSEVKDVVRQANYTVFGREVNLASRLESASGRGRIFIGKTTYEHLLRDDPKLASTCVELPPRELKGFRTAVRAYEVPWRPAGAPPFDEEFFPGAATDGTAFTGFVQRASS